jgi:hypothetical protein
MTRSKLLVLFVIAFIGVGVFAWSWVNFTKSPPHDPAIAQRYFQYFHRRCPLEHGDEDLCREVLGRFHRSCFAEHLRPTPPEDLASEGPFLYSRRLYLDCMNEGVEIVLRESNR